MDGERSLCCAVLLSQLIAKAVVELVVIQNSSSGPPAATFPEEVTSFQPAWLQNFDDLAPGGHGRMHWGNLEPLSAASTCNEGPTDVGPLGPVGATGR